MLSWAGNTPELCMKADACLHLRPMKPFFHGEKPRKLTLETKQNKLIQVFQSNTDSVLKVP
jgi:hypothetical protein